MRATHLIDIKRASAIDAIAKVTSAAIDEQGIC